jgi:myo-inositol-1(or 4)-monophosphatase
MSRESVNPYLKERQVARRAATEAGRFLMKNFPGRETIRVAVKQGQITNYVTRVDRGSETLVRTLLRRTFPRDTFLGEETGNRPGTGSRRWIVDPLDGTTNYLHGFPMFSVSIALEEEGDLKVGIVLDPVRKECFEAVRGFGATLNNRPIHVSRRRAFRHALVATGFPFRDFSRMNTYLAIFEKVARGTAGIRRPGSASLDLCYLSCGRVDAFWEFALGPWDVAAGSLIIQEAGGRVTDMSGQDWGDRILAGNIVASNGLLHPDMLRMVRLGVSKEKKNRKTRVL